MKAPAPPIWKLSRARYDRMIETGILGEDDKVELLDGLLVVREPQGSRHPTAVMLVRAALEKAFVRRFHVREEKPVALDRMSEPEPDVVVVRGRIRDYGHAHPSKPILIVEVAESSLRLDRLRKGALYARAGVADYWVLNLVEDMLEVYRKPVRETAGGNGWKYASVRVLKASGVVTPLAAPRARMRVASMLP